MTSRNSYKFYVVTASGYDPEFNWADCCEQEDNEENRKIYENTACDYVHKYLNDENIGYVDIIVDKTARDEIEMLQRMSLARRIGASLAENAERHQHIIVTCIKHEEVMKCKIHKLNDNTKERLRTPDSPPLLEESDSEVV